MKNTKRRGFSLVELIVILAILAIVAGLSIGIGYKQVKNSRVQETTAFLQTMASNIEECIMDNGFLDVETSTSDADIRAYMNEMADVYLSCGIDVNTITRLEVDDMKGFHLTLTLAEDAWQMPYELYYLTNYEAVGSEQAKYFISIASVGPNNVAASAAATGYYNSAENGGVDDDILVIMESR